MRKAWSKTAPAVSLLTLLLLSCQTGDMGRGRLPLNYDAALKQYHAGGFNEAYKKFSEYKRLADFNDPSIEYYLGLCAWELKRYRSARYHFEVFSKSTRNERKIAHSHSFPTGLDLDHGY